MKAKLLFPLCVALAMVAFTVRAESLAVRAETDQPPKGQNAMRKLGRGFSNLLFGIVEVPNTITKTTADHGGGAGATYGVSKGIGRWLWREGAGVYEIITFPFPMGRQYKPVMKPEFPNEDIEP